MQRNCVDDHQPDDAPDSKALKHSWYGATPEEKAATRASWNSMDAILRLIVIAVIVMFYVKFW